MSDKKKITMTQFLETYVDAVISTSDISPSNDAIVGSNKKKRSTIIKRTVIDKLFKDNIIDDSNVVETTDELLENTPEKAVKEVKKAIEDEHKKAAKKEINKAVVTPKKKSNASKKD